MNMLPQGYPLWVVQAPLVRWEDYDLSPLDPVSVIGNIRGISGWTGVIGGSSSRQSALAAVSVGPTLSELAVAGIAVARVVGWRESLGVQESLGDDGGWNGRLIPLTVPPLPVWDAEIEMTYHETRQSADKRAILTWQVLMLESGGLGESDAAGVGG